MNFEVKNNKTLINVDDIKKQWSNSPIQIEVNSTEVSNFYPSRINLDYVSDENKSLYLIKNRGWDSYRGKPTMLDTMFDDYETISKAEVDFGYISTVKSYNDLVLSYVKSEFDIDNPDNLTEDNIDSGLSKVMKALDSMFTEYKYIEANENSDSDTSDIKPLILNNLESLGSVYMLYKARQKMIKRS